MPLFVKTLAEPLINSVRCRECHRVQFREFYPKVCTCEGFQSNSSRAFSQTSKESVDFRHVLRFKISSKETLIFFQGDYWCYGYNPETKQQLSQWKTAGSPGLKKARQVKSNFRAILTCVSSRCCAHGIRFPESNCQPEVEKKGEIFGA